DKDGFMHSQSGHRVFSFAFAVLVAFGAAPPLLAAIDSDGDGFGSAVDCNDQNDQVWALPGEVLQLRIAADKLTLSWDPPAVLGGVASSVRYDTLRSTSPSNFASLPWVACSDPEGLTTSSTETATPPVGTAFFYLVRAKNDCGDGSLGTSSDGTPRAGMT